MKRWEYMNLKFKMNAGAVVQNLEQGLISNYVFLNERRKQGWEVVSIVSEPSDKGDLNLAVFLRREIDSKSDTEEKGLTHSCTSMTTAF